MPKSQSYLVKFCKLMRENIMKFSFSLKNKEASLEADVEKLIEKNICE